MYYHSISHEYLGYVGYVTNGNMNLTNPDLLRTGKYQQARDSSGSWLMECVEYAA